MVTLVKSQNKDKKLILSHISRFKMWKGSIHVFLALFVTLQYASSFSLPFRLRSAISTSNARLEAYTGPFPFVDAEFTSPQSSESAHINGGYGFLRLALLRSKTLITKLLLSPAYRQELLNMITLRWKSLARNIVEGESGRRGEEFVIAQAVLLLFVFLGVNPFIALLIRLLGLVCSSYGLYMMTRGSWVLEANLSPYVKPVRGNYLVTHDIFDDVRHPIYGGVMLVCVGVSIVCNSVDRMLFALFLSLLLSFKVKIFLCLFAFE